MATTKARTPGQIEAEIEALKARIRRLRLEKKLAALAESEAQLLRIAGGNPEPEQAGGSR